MGFLFFFFKPIHAFLGWHTHLFAIVGDRRQNGAQRFDAHGNVQEMSGEEEVVVMSENRHQQIPNQIEESLRRQSRAVSLSMFTTILNLPSLTYIVCENDTKLPDLVLHVNRCDPAEEQDMFRV